MRLAAHRAVTMLNEAERSGDFVANAATQAAASQYCACHCAATFKPNISVTACQYGAWLVAVRS